MSSPLPDRLSTSISLTQDVTAVKLVSPARATALRGMGVYSVRDLMTLYPRRYLDLSHVETVLSARIGEQCSIVGSVFSLVLKTPKPRLSLVEITLNDGTGTLIVTAFRQPWLMDKVKVGMKIAVAGTLEFNFGAKRMTNPFVEVLDDGEAGFHGRIIPVHPACEKISPAWMRTIMDRALGQFLPVFDPLPMELRRKYRLYSRTQALKCIHFPQSTEELKEAKRRLIYEELLGLELTLMQEAYRRNAAFEPRAHVTDGPLMKAFRDSCPFALTGDQQMAVEEVLTGMAAPRRMDHLLLGDVGTGKTLVAAFALVAAADTGTQAVFLAPTEILANQHFASLEKLFGGLGLRIALLTASTSAAQRALILENLAAGTLDVLVGTHAVLEPDVRPGDCSLVIIDEQQRFGVDQRAALLERAPGADALYLTATPIPRTLALSLYGDLTLSYLRERPVAGAGRTTTVLGWKQKGDAYQAALEALEEGRQVYVVCPLVNGPDEAAKQTAKSKKSSGKDDAATLNYYEGEETYEYATVSIETDDDFPEDAPAAATERSRILAETVFSGYEVGLLHGKMSGAEKRRVMDEFAAGRIRVLVATTVIEVGIDVPNATVMIIDNADRFGLSQLHQLRGRVGRGVYPGKVFLLSSSESKNALSRLAAMTRTDDGFELATYDLSLRREGDILGNRQHGASVLKLVNVVRDQAVVEAAHGDARAIMEVDPELTLPEHRALARDLVEMFPDVSVKAGG